MEKASDGSFARSTRKTDDDGDEKESDRTLNRYTSEYYETDDEAKLERAGEAELIIAKQRNGPTGDVPLTFLKQYTRFETRTREHA